MVFNFYILFYLILVFFFCQHRGNFLFFMMFHTHIMKSRISKLLSVLLLYNPVGFSGGPLISCRQFSSKTKSESLCTASTKCAISTVQTDQAAGIPFLCGRAYMAADSIRICGTVISPQVRFFTHLWDRNTSTGFFTSVGQKYSHGCVFLHIWTVIPVVF